MAPLSSAPEEMAAGLPGLLLPWFSENARDLPWRRDREPYHVWLSEIMLQQTRVETVKAYYSRFLSVLPDIPALSAADDALLTKLWEGLGYYSRVRNLKKAAVRIMEDFGGTFPRRYEEIRSLPGIGEYTAGAIASICFDERTPAVDGNVLRVMARFLGDDGNIDDPAVKRAVRARLTEIYPEEAGAFTQALMELGAIVCLPNGAPLCPVCPLRERCRARAEGTIDSLPVRSEKKKRRREEKTVLLLTHDGKIAIRQRPETGLLAGLWEFPNFPGLSDDRETLAAAEKLGLHPREIYSSVSRKHIFTHIEWALRGVRMECGAAIPDFVWVDRAALEENYALPTAFRQFLPDFS